MALKLSSHLIPHLPVSLERFQRCSPAHLTTSPIPIFTGFGCSLVATSSSTIPSCINWGRFITHAVKEEQSQSSTMAKTENPEEKPSSSKLVLVVGGTGGVGQLVVASLLSRNIKSRLLLRDPMKAVSLFGIQDEDRLQVFKGDTRNPSDLVPDMFEDLYHRESHM